ncbi:hypothetical protein GCM10008944_20660 [Cytobacillus oceanisediminis]
MIAGPDLYVSPADNSSMNPLENSPFGRIPDDLWTFGPSGDEALPADAPTPVRGPLPSLSVSRASADLHELPLALLSPTAVSVLEDLARWGPVTDDLLARLRQRERRTHALERSTVRNYVVELTRAGVIESLPRFRRSASARVVRPEGQIFLGIEPSPSNAPRTDPLALDRMLSLDVALRTAKPEHRILGQQKVLDTHEHIDPVTGRAMTLLMQSATGATWRWVPDVVIGAGAELWAVAAFVPGTDVAKRRVVERVLAHGAYSRFILTTRSAAVAAHVREQLFRKPMAGRLDVELIFE